MHIMKRRQKGVTRTRKRRVTVTLPGEVLARAEGIARVRKVSLSTVVAEAIDEGLPIRLAAERGERVLESYRRAFADFTDGEMMLLDEIIPANNSK